MQTETESSACTALDYQRDLNHVLLLCFKVMAAKVQDTAAYYTPNGQQRQLTHRWY